MATVLLLLLFACHSTVANAAVALGATRVIYPANQKQVLLPVTNNDPASVYLIQSWIENAGDQKDTQFVITPPLFSIIENQTGIHTDWRGYAILPFATEYRENRVALNANSLADNVELDETVVTVIPTHGAIARATFNAQIGGKVLMTLKYGNKSVPFGAIVTHGENKNGSIVAENGQVYLTGLPQSGKLQVSWGNDKNSNCIVDYKLPEVSPGTLLNQQTAICR
ncbi:fimbria/pilus outer membrane usher protein [Escherichia coli]|nr:fimbria/pilus outer membrane usher protein [Escherichia coli]